MHLSPASLKALRYAVRVTESSGSKIWLVYLQPAAPLLGGLESVPWLLSDEEVCLRAQRILQRCLRREVPPRRQGGVLARTGSPAHGIPQTALRLAIDLIVTTTHGYTGLQRLLHPSIAERVVRWASCPGLTINRALLEENTPGWERVLVPVDFSSCSETCLHYAAAFPHPEEVHFFLLQVVELFPIDYIFGLKTDREECNRLEQQARAELDSLRRRCANTGGRAVRTLVRFGKPYREIVKVANEVKAQLVIMGTHGYCGLRHFQFGSTAERVVRLAPCPVLVVHGQEQEFAGSGSILDQPSSEREPNLSA